MKTYALGSHIAPDIWAPSPTDLKKYWLLQEDGAPCPDTKPFLRRWEIESMHKRTGEPYRILTGKRGRPKGPR